MFLKFYKTNMHLSKKYTVNRKKHKHSYMILLPLIVNNFYFGFQPVVYQLKLLQSNKFFIN